MNKLALTLCFSLVFGASTLQALSTPNAAYLGIDVLPVDISGGIIKRHLTLEDRYHKERVTIVDTFKLNFPVSVFYPSNATLGTSIDDPNLDYVTYEVFERRFKLGVIVDTIDMFGPLHVWLTNSRLLMQTAATAPLHQLPSTLDGGSTYRCYAVKATSTDNPGVIAHNGNFVTSKIVRLFGNAPSDPVFHVTKPLRFCVAVKETLDNGEVISNPYLFSPLNNLMCYALDAKLALLPFGEGANTLDAFGRLRLLFINDGFALCLPAAFPI
jgi:hypothetical protein